MPEARFLAEAEMGETAEGMGSQQLLELEMKVTQRWPIGLQDCKNFSLCFLQLFSQTGNGIWVMATNIHQNMWLSLQGYVFSE